MKPPFASEAVAAYTAGIIDGEGHVTARIRSGPKGGLDSVVTVANTDKAMIDWLHAQWGGAIYTYPPRGKHHRQQWTWKLHGRGVVVMLTAVLPYLITKQRQAELVIELSQSIRPVGRRGYTPAERQERSRLVAEIGALNKRGVA